METPPLPDVFYDFPDYMGSEMGTVGEEVVGRPSVFELLTENFGDLLRYRRGPWASRFFASRPTVADFVAEVEDLEVDFAGYEFGSAEHVSIVEELYETVATLPEDERLAATMLEVGATLEAAQDALMFEGAHAVSQATLQAIASLISIVTGAIATSQAGVDRDEDHGAEHRGGGHYRDPTTGHSVPLIPQPDPRFPWERPVTVVKRLGQGGIYTPITELPFWYFLH